MSLQEYVDKHKHPIPLVIIKCSEAIDRACEFFVSSLTRGFMITVVISIQGTVLTIAASNTYV